MKTTKLEQTSLGLALICFLAITTVAVACPSGSSGQQPSGGSCSFPYGKAPVETCYTACQQPPNVCIVNMDSCCNITGVSCSPAGTIQPSCIADPNCNPG